MPSTAAQITTATSIVHPAYGADPHRPRRMRLKGDYRHRVWPQLSARPNPDTTVSPAPTPTLTVTTLGQTTTSGTVLGIWTIPEQCFSIGTPSPIIAMTLSATPTRPTSPTTTMKVSSKKHHHLAPPISNPSIITSTMPQQLLLLCRFKAVF